MLPPLSPAPGSDPLKSLDVASPAASKTSKKSARTRAFREGRNAAFREAWVSEFGTADALGTAARDNDLVRVPCPRHAAPLIRLGTLYKRHAQGKALCSACDRETEQGRENHEAGVRRRANAVKEAGARQWAATVVPALDAACARLQLSVVNGYGGPSQSLELLCAKHLSEGPFNLRFPRKLLKADDSPCPHCVGEQRMLKPWLRWAADPVLRETVYRVRRNGSAWARDGGYLYRIVDAGSLRQYIGLTTLSLEVRWEGHVRDAAEKDRPLYRAMRERPADFRIETIAFFRTREDLRQAEREWVRQEGTMWPAGYNLSRGGEAAGNAPDSDIQAYALRHELDSRQVAHLLDWASWAPGLDLTRGGLSTRLLTNMSYADIISKPTPKDRPLMLGATWYASVTDACASMGLEKLNVSPIASEAGVAMPEMLQFMHHLRTACGPWVLEGIVESTLEGLRQRVNVSPARLLRLSLEFDESALQALYRLAEGGGERVDGVLYLSREDACRSRGIKLQTVLGRMVRNALSFEAAVLACASSVQQRRHAYRKVRRPSEAFVFRGQPYANPTQAGAAFGVPSNTLSYWRGLFADPAEALEACLRSKEGSFKRVKAAFGAPRMRIRDTDYTSLRHAAKALSLNIDELKNTAARPGFCRESAVEYLLRHREGRRDLDLAGIRDSLGLTDFPVLDSPTPDEQTWLDSLQAAFRCVTRRYALSAGLKRWLADQDEPDARTGRLDVVWERYRTTFLAATLGDLHETEQRTAQRVRSKDPQVLAARDVAGLAGLEELFGLQGSIRVPAAPRWRALRTWVQDVRRLHAKGRLKPVLHDRLTALGFDFSQVGDDWWLALEELRRFAARHGHCTPASTDEGGKSLSTWVTSQRQRRRLKGEGSFSAAQLAALAELGFVWDMRELWWGRGVSLLKAFMDEHGHGYVPDTDIGQVAELRSFCASVRKARTQGYLEGGRAAELDALGFVWQAGVKGQMPGVRYLKQMGRCARTEQRAA